MKVCLWSVLMLAGHYCEAQPGPTYNAGGVRRRLRPNNGGGGVDTGGGEGGGDNMDDGWRGGNDMSGGGGGGNNIEVSAYFLFLGFLSCAICSPKENTLYLSSTCI